MKFFSELGSCYRPATSAPSRQREHDEAIDVVTPLSSSRRHHQYRAKDMNKLGTGGSTSSAAHNWRPGLLAIREDDGTVLDMKGQSTERKPHSGKKSRDRYTSKPRRVSHSHNDDYCRNNYSAPMIMPPFSPTPFMF